MLTPAQRDLLFVGGLVGLVALPPAVRFLLRVLRLQRPNYRGKVVPVGYGLVVVLWSTGMLAVSAHWLEATRATLGAYLLVVAGFGALGLLDDLWGTRQARGLRGHLRALLQERRVTTGLVKAVGGLLLALLATRVVLRSPWPIAAVDTGLIALGANALNLLDLRPGRALAAFLALAAVLCAAGAAAGRLPYPLALLCAPALVIYDRDARARAMLGDTGANPLGAALGLAAAMTVPSPYARCLILLLLVALHVLAERRSLSALIEAHPLLRRIDSLSGQR